MTKKSFGIFICLTLLFLFLSQVFALEKEVFFSPKKEGKVVQNYNEKTGHTYSVLVISKNGKIFAAAENYPKQPSIRWHNDHLVEVRLSCGSPCSNSFFCDVYSDQSTTIPMMLALNSAENVVAYADSTSIKVKKIFPASSPVLLEIKRDFSPVATLVSAISEIRFEKNGDLFISYLSGNSYEEKQEIVKISDLEKK